MVANCLVASHSQARSPGERGGLKQLAILQRHRQELGHVDILAMISPCCMDPADDWQPSSITRLFAAEAEANAPSPRRHVWCRGEDGKESLATWPDASVTEPRPT